ncbi:hypothetical protein PUN28_007779 [Cardiocondyla obscurior]|uniref:Uncharacterized protein n=1 Tax=Cardiocondyla obscurior TaxID=286306 RepID=A0AAW2FUU5_9HYME
MPFPELHVIVVTGNNSMTHCGNDNCLPLKEGPTRHSTDILRGGGSPGRASCFGGATFSQRQNTPTPLKLQIGESHHFISLWFVIGAFQKIARLHGFFLMT